MARRNIRAISFLPVGNVEVWGLAKATTEKFNTKKRRVRKVQGGTAALEWLSGFGFESFAISKLPIPRYGIITLNNVKSANSRLREIRWYNILIF